MCYVVWEASEKGESAVFKDSRKALVLACAVSTVFICWNLYDEMPRDFPLFVLMGIFLGWVFVPYCAMAIGVLAKTSATRWASLIVELTLMPVFMMYAFNGSSRSRVGAQHMHLFLVPFLLPCIAGIVLALLLLLFFVTRVGRGVVRRAGAARNKSPQGE